MLPMFILIFMMIQFIENILFKSADLEIMAETV